MTKRGVPAQEHPSNPFFAGALSTIFFTSLQGLPCGGRGRSRQGRGPSRFFRDSLDWRALAKAIRTLGCCDGLFSRDFRIDESALLLTDERQFLVNPVPI